MHIYYLLHRSFIQEITHSDFGIDIQEIKAINDDLIYVSSTKFHAKRIFSIEKCGKKKISLEGVRGSALNPKNNFLIAASFPNIHRQSVTKHIIVLVKETTSGVGYQICSLKNTLRSSVLKCII